MPSTAHERCTSAAGSAVASLCRMSEVLPRVLVAEDDDAIRTMLVAALRRDPFEVDSAADGEAALRLTSACEYAVIVLDLMMPRLNGYDFLEAFRKSTPTARSVVFVMTAFDQLHHGELGATQVHAVIRKPFDVPQLVAMVRDVALMWNVQTRLPAAAESRRAPVRSAAEEREQRPN